MFGGEDLDDGAASAEASRYRGERCHEEDRSHYHDDHLPERCKRYRVGIGRLDEGDPSWNSQDGADEGRKHLRRRQSRADLLWGRTQRACER